MKWHVGLVLAVLLLAPWGAWADGPDEQYVNIYNLIQQADSLRSSGSLEEALAKYLEVQTALRRFQRLYPDWNPKVVGFRVSYVAERVAALSATVAPPAAPAPAATNPPPALAPRVRGNTPAPPEKPERSDLENQVNALVGQVRALQADKLVLEAKLKEALAAQPAAVDPRELARAQDRIRSLEKENDLLKVTLADEKAKGAPAAEEAKTLAEMQQALAEANRKLAEQTQKADALAQARQFLASKLLLLSPSKENTEALETTRKALADANQQLGRQKELTAKLTSEKATLESRLKTLTPESEAATALRAENAVLKQQLVNAKAAPPATGNAADTSRQLAETRAQVAALESDRDILRLERIALDNRVQQLKARMATNAAVMVTNTVVVTKTVMVAPPKADDSARVKALQRERDELQKKAEAATKELNRHKSKVAAAHVNDLENQLAALRSRLDVFEARQVPFTEEEQALFSKPVAKLSESNAPPAKASASKPPPGAVALVAQAQRYFVSRQFDKAEEAYVQVLQLGQTNVFTLANLATVELEDNQFEAAETNLLQALALAPDDAYTLSILGNLRYRQKRYDDALDVLTRAAKLDPQSAEIQNYLGLALAEKGLRGPAETAFRKSVQLAPNYAGAHVNLAVIYLSQQPPATELARWHYQRALNNGHPRDQYLEKMLEIRR
jgi:hypothetical protein